MADWQMWLIAASGLVILEMFTGTFYLLMISIGLVAGAIAALLGIGVSFQIVVAALIGVVATTILRRSKIGRFPRKNAACDPNVNLDIGQTISVKDWSQDEGGRNIARVMYRGAMWDVELAPEAAAHSGTFKIQEIRGSHLILTNAQEITEAKAVSHP